MSIRTRKAQYHLAAWVVATSLMSAGVALVVLLRGAMFGGVLMATLLLLIVLIAVPGIRVAVGYSLSTFLIIAASSTTASQSEAAVVLSVGLRVVGFSGLIVLGLIRARNLGTTALTQTSSRWLLVLGGSLGVYFVVGAGFHGQFLQLVLYSIGLVLLVTAGVIHQKAHDPALREGVILALFALIAVSLVVGLVTPSSAVENGRLRGLLENANSLGFFAFLLGAAGLITIKSKRVRAAALLLATVALIWSASRASALALVIVVLVVLVHKGFTRTILFAVSVMALCGITYLLDPSLFEPLTRLVRFNDSRSASTETALEAYSISPLIGVGLDNESAIIASSPFRALAQAGIFGLLAVLTMWAALLVQGARRGHVLLALALAAVVHSIFEGWLLSPVSPLLTVFTLLWLASADGERSPLAQARPHPPTTALRDARKAPLS